MSDEKPILTHKSIASNCFNSVWEYIEQPKRTSEETEKMIHLAHSSFWHWTQVEDHTPTNLSIGLWLLSRTYASAELSERSAYFATRCIDVSEENNLPPFFVGYALEALARAKALSDDKEDVASLINRAKKLAQDVEDVDDKELLLKDLSTIQQS